MVFDMAIAREVSESVQHAEPDLILVMLPFSYLGDLVHCLHILVLVLSSQEHLIYGRKLTNSEILEAFEGLLVTSLAVRIVQTLLIYR